MGAERASSLDATTVCITGRSKGRHAGHQELSTAFPLGYGGVARLWSREPGPSHSPLDFQMLDT